VRYVINGKYKIDNNLAENGVRPLALGRKITSSAVIMKRQNVQQLSILYWEPAKLTKSILNIG
jgi:hypothetical protein